MGSEAGRNRVPATMLAEGALRHLEGGRVNQKRLASVVLSAPSPRHRQPFLVSCSLDMVKV